MIPSMQHGFSAGLLFIAHLIVWTFIITLSLVIGILSYRILAHPLAALPGPKLAALSNIWLAYHVRNGRSVSIGRHLHQKYGSVVRVGPNEVWFDSKEAFRSIYSAGSRFEKSDFYPLPRPDLDWRLQPISVDSLDLLSERDMKRYRKQRRAVGPIYQPSNLIRYESAIDSVLAKVVEKLQSHDGADIDLKEWMHMIAVECLGATVLSWSPGMLKRGTDSGTSHHAYLSWRRKSVFGLFPTIMKLAYIFKPLDRVFSVIWGITYKPPRNFRTFFPDVGKRVSKRINMALHRQSKPGAHHDLMTDLIDLHTRKPDFNEIYLKRMAVTNFGAGHETLTATLTSIFTLLASHPEAYARLAAEIRKTHHDARLFSELIRLPHLQASIQEAKRLRPVIGMALSRTVPHGGVHLHGHYIPAGTTVGCNPTALHCNPDICGSDPYSYKPDRWSLSSSSSSSPAAAKDMEAFSLSWGGGSRTCPGRHLAELIVFKTVAALVQQFDVQVTVPRDSDMPSYFMSMPTGVRARFIEVGGDAGQGMSATRRQ